MVLHCGLRAKSILCKGAEIDCTYSIPKRSKCCSAPPRKVFLSRFSKLNNQLRSYVTSGGQNRATVD